MGKKFDLATEALRKQDEYKYQSSEDIDTIDQRIAFGKRKEQARFQKRIKNQIPVIQEKINETKERIPASTLKEKTKLNKKICYFSRLIYALEQRAQLSTATMQELGVIQKNRIIQDEELQIRDEGFVEDRVSVSLMDLIVF